MKTALNLSVAVALSTLAFADTADQSDHFVLNNMTKASFTEFREGQKEVIILLEKNTILPLKFLIDGTSFAFEGDNIIGNLIVKEPFYMTLKDGEPYFSKDKKDWKTIFHFWGGQFTCGICIDDDSEHPQASLKVELLQK